MAEKAKSLVEVMKSRIANTGSKKGSFFYLRNDNKTRIRFLQDMEDGFQVSFHDKWGEFNHPCLSYFGKECPNCDNKEARTMDNFVWSIWNYETKQVELFMYKANRSSPIPALVSMYESYGTLMDRDFVIERKGAGTDTTYSVIPMDKSAFRGKSEPILKKKAMGMILDSFPPPDADFDMGDDEDEEDEEYEAPVKTKSKVKAVAKPASKKSKKDEVPWDEDDEDEDDEDDEDEENDEDDEDEEEEPAHVRRPKAAPAPARRARR